jgi:hypothetical protein
MIAQKYLQVRLIRSPTISNTKPAASTDSDSDSGPVLSDIDESQSVQSQGQTESDPATEQSPPHRGEAEAGAGLAPSPHSQGPTEAGAGVPLSQPVALQPPPS